MDKGGYGRNRGLTTQKSGLSRNDRFDADDALGLARRAKQGEQG